MAVTVEIFVKDDTISAAPIPGVIVGVYNPSDLSQVASGTTDSGGQASFMLPGSVGPNGTPYEVRFFKVGVIFRNPQQIAVIEPVTPPQTNIFDFSGTLLTLLPTATDPRLCRCTGRFMDFSNQPISGLSVRIHSKADSGFQIPLLVDGNLIAPDRMNFKTDQNGFLTVDLVRSGEYEVVFAGDEDDAWDIVVPDRSSVNLIDLIHPVPALLIWDSTVAPSNAVSVAVGASLEIPFSAIFTNYQTVASGLLNWLNFINNDDSIVDVFVGDSIVTVTGKAPGSTTVTGHNLDGLFPVTVPALATTVPTLSITVTP